jgi:AhpC/TSA family
MAGTVIYDDREPHALDAGAREDGDRLWISEADLEPATGWTLKPQGLCRDEACVPLPPDGSWLDEEGRLDLTAFARADARPTVRDEEHGIWAFGPSMAVVPDGLEAPDFTLPDIDGEMHSLSDYRGQKVFLYTWGSYCGCSFDPPVWEVIYQEMREKNLEMISVALDTAGKAAVQERIRPDELDQRPDTLRRLRGWSEQQWEAKAAPSHPCLIDESHELAVKYGMSNVPMAVWIDEAGRIVRPSEPAGVTDHFRSMDPESFELPHDDAAALEANRARYVDALRDWVDNGDESEYALTPEQVRDRVHRPAETEVVAGLHIRIASHLFHQGDTPAAKRHAEAAVELCPEKWNYRRQSMALDPDTVGALNVSPGFWSAMEALGSGSFYEEISLPGIVGHNR